MSPAPAAAPLFVDAAEVADVLRGTGYIPDDRMAHVVHLADALSKPILIEGPAGVGKTELAKSVAAATGARLIRLQCYEGLDEARALYEWDFRKQLLHIHVQRDAGEPDRVAEDLFAERFLLARPLLQAITADEPVVLLVDEVDRLDVETEALLLEVLSEFQVSIPELGTISARSIPRVFLTSNGMRDLSEALKRRCLYLYLDYPNPEREQQIVLARVPGIAPDLAAQLTEVVHALRGQELKKRPSVAESIDWARTLLVIGAETIDEQVLAATLPVLLKHRADLDLVGRGDLFAASDDV